MPDYDVIVLGLGGIGSGAAYWLAKRGSRVLGIEQFELGHARGESHDHSRIIRLSYCTPPYVRLAKEAYAAWASVERDSGEQLVFKTGGLDIGPQGGAIPLEGYADAMRACDVPFEWLDASEIRKRWPAFAVGDEIRALFQAESGIVAAERATAAHQRAARAHGATLLDRSPITGVRARGGEIVVEAGGERHSAGALVIAAGPWSAQALAKFDITLPLEVTKEQAMYFRPRNVERFAFGHFPVWIWMDDPSFYGFPVFGESGAVKVTQDAGGKPVDADARTFEEDPEITQRVRSFLERYLPEANGERHLVKTCLYTLTPDRDFVIDTLPEHPNVSVAIGAGHAYKFASVIGRIAGELATNGTTTSGIGDFKIDRPILQMEAPPKSYMV
ncbi:MAG TPA: N-methyl-L-tryptophan oxidase [Candidatus Baltobacteraceae bacterium]|nr:N-methyl-L-tryptophan oxidase [Candidatus Baltobacteraceae bacterium]